MNNCLITTLKASVENSKLKKLGELRLKAINDGQLVLRPEYGDITLRVISGSASYDGQAITTGTSIQQRNTDATISVTKDTVLAIENKYALSILTTSVMELTDGDTLESLYYSQFVHLGLAGDTYGSIEGLDTTRLIRLLFDNTKISGDLSIFAGSDVIRRIQIRNTNITGNLSVLTGKTLDSSCHFDNCNLNVNLADISSMSSGLDTIAKYINTYLYGDASSLPASDNLIGMQSEEKIIPFTWLTQRHNTSGAYILGNQRASGTIFIDYGTYLDAMLLDQAQCEASSSSTKTIIVYGTHTDNSGWETAVATLQSKGYTVTINGETL